MTSSGLLCQTALRTSHICFYRFESYSSWQVNSCLICKFGRLAFSKLVLKPQIKVSFLVIQKERSLRDLRQIVYFWISTLFHPFQAPLSAVPTSTSKKTINVFLMSKCRKIQNVSRDSETTNVHKYRRWTAMSVKDASGYPFLLFPHPLPSLSLLGESS